MSQKKPGQHIGGYRMVVGVKEVGMVGQPTQPENDQHDNEHLGKLKFGIKYMKIWWPRESSSCLKLRIVIPGKNYKMWGKGG